MNEILAWGTRAIVVALAATLLAVTTQSLAQEGTAPLPPQVIAVQPYPGEEVLADQPVTLVFDQAMDAASVEAAWQMEPAAPLEFTWEDARTLHAIPAGGWQRATRYAVTLGTGAQSADGVALAEPHKFFVQTIGRLEVATVIPAEGAEGVAADATITVSFNRPVVPLVSTGELEGLPDPLQFEPVVEGQGEWINTSIYQFTPAKPLAGGTTYTVSIAAGLSDVLGATLDETFTWQFKTLAPEVLNVSPYYNQSEVRLEAPVVIELSQPMDRASTEAAFALLFSGERVAGKFTWSDDSRTLTFQPDAMLRLEANYLITLAPTARGISGEATLKEGLSYVFSTVPAPMRAPACSPGCGAAPSHRCPCRRPCPSSGPGHGRGSPSPCGRPRAARPSAARRSPSPLGRGGVTHGRARPRRPRHGRGHGSSADAPCPDHRPSTLGRSLRDGSSSRTCHARDGSGCAAR